MTSPITPKIADETVASGFLWRIGQAIRHVSDAELAIDTLAPRSCDYATPGDLERARAEHYSRIARIRDIAEELRIIASTVDDRP